MSDLHEKSMAILHEAAGVKRDGLAGLLAWIEDRKADRAEADSLRAQVRDLKARLKRVREMIAHGTHQGSVAVNVGRDMLAATDLRRKNWRKP